MTTWSFWFRRCGACIYVCLCVLLWKRFGYGLFCWWSAQTAPGSGCGWGLWTRGSVRGAALSQHSQSPPHPLLAPPLPPPQAPSPAPPPSGKADALLAPWRSPGIQVLHCNLLVLCSCDIFQLHHGLDNTRLISAQNRKVQLCYLSQFENVSLASPQRKL